VATLRSSCRCEERGHVSALGDEGHVTHGDNDDDTQKPPPCALVHCVRRQRNHGALGSACAGVGCGHGRRERGGAIRGESGLGLGRALVPDDMVAIVRTIRVLCGHVPLERIRDVGNSSNALFERRMPPGLSIASTLASARL
jgi:hypothetical protein